ncbi:hypothetical protein GGR23_000414 [Gellertiella hungarica]|uniref:Polysaccharide lyase-like protein n=2 Tax=Gellertiella hungarica TaxID=1572859 RepID=A0A7W6J1X4_9HYPH|nr:polysaccharide lyase [Gellertiella hungarica]MBB4063253.1 hypothetical protein [Gellertiella hungarica]
MMKRLTTTLALSALCLAAPAVAASAADALQQRLYDGFEGQDFAPEGGLYYKKNDEQAAGTFTFQSEEKFAGKQGLKLSVRENCASEIENCSERAEIWERPELRVPYDKGVWVGFAMKFADPIPQNDHRYLIAQWKREIGPDAEGDFSPFLALRMRNGKLFATVETNYHKPESASSGSHAVATCPDGQTPVWLRPETNQIRALVATDSAFQPGDGEEFTACSSAIRVTRHGNPLPLPSSGWIDFAVYTRPGADGSGHIELFANGKPIVTVKGAIGHNDFGLLENQYFKFGPYRAAGEGVWTLYYDEYRRSPDCMDVLKDAALCAAAR